MVVIELTEKGVVFKAPWVFVLAMLALLLFFKIA